MSKVLIQVLLFVLAIVILWPATFAVLRIDPGIGNILRVAALIILVGNLVWVLSSLNSWKRIVLHVLLFLLAIGVFILGLGVGLQFNSTYGTILWIVAGVIFVLNLLWMFGVLGRR
ncbi:MAG: DUF2207 domain-containing protein [Chloroflexi bacterium]|nr:DUF2207 domain-containing protein [Chloroflexota bacterium]